MLQKASDITRFCARLAYHFKQTALLQQALTHRSVRAQNNERLEFLGDSVLNLVITALLLARFPEHAEGRLSRMRAVLVREETLAEVALKLEIGDIVKLGPGELRSGGHRRKSILADALEAVFGAIYLDGGFDAIKGVIERLFDERCDPNALEYKMFDHKSSLQEYLQSKKKPLPVYTLTRVTGELHEQIFHVSCAVLGVSVEGKGQGVSRREAEQAAAYQLLRQLKK